MVKPPTVPEYPFKSYDQKLFGTVGTWTTDLGIWQCLTFEPLGPFQSVLHENNLEFSAQSNGKISDSPRSFLKKFRPKIAWNLQDSNRRPLYLTVSIFGTIESNSLELSGQSIGKTSNSSRSFLKKIWPKIAWNCWDSNHRPLSLTVSNFRTIESISKCFTWKQLRIICPIHW